MHQAGNASPFRLRRRSVGLLATAAAIPTAVALMLPSAAAAQTTTPVPSTTTSAAPTSTTTSAPATSAATTTTEAPAEAQATGATIKSITWLTDRQITLTVDSPVMQAPISVGIMLPRTWNSDVNATYPAYILLDGFRVANDGSDWLNQTDIEEFSKDKDALFVVAYGGEGSFYADWKNPDPNAGPQGQMQWETFYNSELPKVLQDNFRFNGTKAIGGLSMGATAAWQYAFKYPGAYKAAMSFSGYLNTTAPLYPQILQYSIATNTNLNPDNLWGNPFTDPLWPGNDPFNNVEKLRGTYMFASSGDGLAGFADTPGLFGLSSNYTGSLLEILSRISSFNTTAKMAVLGIPVTTSYYTGGTHSWPYWQRELKSSWPGVANALGIPVGGTGGCATDGRLASAVTADGLGACTTGVYNVQGGIAQDFFNGRAFLATGAEGPGSLKGLNGAKFQDLGGTGGAKTNPATTAPFNANGTFLGLPVTPEIVTPNELGVYNVFSLFSVHIYFSPATLSHVVGGAIFDKWGTFGFEGGEMGFPATDELIPLGKPEARYNAFQVGQIVWSPATGAHQIKGAILGYFASRPGIGTGSAYGLPTSDEIDNGATITQNFQGGTITYVKATGALSGTAG